MFNKLSLASIILLLAMFLGVGTHSPAASKVTAATLTPTPDSSTRGWTFVDPRDPALPELITSSPDGYHLDGKWSVTKVEYLYTHSPDGDYDYQAIERVSGIYVRDRKAAISAALVNRLLQAINKLQLAQALVSSNTHSDDYPSWQVDLTGEDGQHISLYSQSTDTPGQSPWNVLYNGRLYVQFDSAIGKAVFQLFTSKQSRLDGVVIPAHPANTLEYDAFGLPSPMTQGFVGLLPIADSFSYEIDAAKSQLNGSFWPYDSTDWKGETLSAPALDALSARLGGTLNGIKAVELTLSGNQKLACTPSAKTWEFTCKLPTVPDQRYLRIPIKLTLSTNNGRQMTTEGELRRGWPATAALQIPLSEEVQKPLMAVPAVADLATDHVIRVEYGAERSLDGSIAPAIDAKAKIFGQAASNGSTVRYVVDTHFIIHDNQVQSWAITRSAIHQMLDDITSTALFKRAARLAPDLVVSMSYETATLTSPDIPESAALTTTQDYVACGERPAISLPNAQQPLQRFSFNRQVTFDDIFYYYPEDFVLINHVPFADSIYYRPDQEDIKVGALLTPPELVNSALKPLYLIELTERAGVSSLYLELPHEADDQAVAQYEQMIKALPGTVQTTDKQSWNVNDVTLAITADGTLTVQPCSLVF